MTKAGPVLTKDVLDRLLTSLDPDRGRAAQKYETLRSGLVRFFEWRGCTFPADHADEAIDRLARRISDGEDIRDIPGYAAGVARFLFKEILKNLERERAALRELPRSRLAADDTTGDESARMGCIHRCLQLLAPETSELLIAYYQGDKADKIQGRKQLATRLGVSAEALRMRILRLRAQLDECVVDCVNRPPVRS